jgi:hypothetical protein
MEIYKPVRLDIFNKYLHLFEQYLTQSEEANPGTNSKGPSSVSNTQEQERSKSSLIRQELSKKWKQFDDLYRK